jgi:hypothetical protein
MNPISIERIGKMEYYEPHWYSAEGYYSAVGSPRAGITGGSEAPDSPKWIAITEKITKLNSVISDAEKELKKSYSQIQIFYTSMNNPTDEDDIKQKRKNPDEWRKKWGARIKATENQIDKWIKNVAQAKLDLHNYKVEVGLLPQSSTPPPTPSEALKQSKSTYVQGSENDPTVIAQRQIDSETIEGSKRTSGTDNSKKIKIIVGITLVSIIGYAIFKVVKK